MHKRWYS